MTRSPIALLAKALCLIAFVSSSSAASPPAPYGATPTEAHVAWQEMEYYGLIHFGLNTYTGMEWGYGDTEPQRFNPDQLDTGQWARGARDAGMKGLILVAKHHDGFCLWPSRTTNYDIAASPWKDGKGDLVADFIASCKKFRLKPGIYISPWDRNHAEYGREGYVKAFHEQWRELLELYGEDLFELWLDGANGGDGYYGGARETRSIDQDYYKYPELYAMMKRLAPQAVVFQGNSHPDSVRWNGNETGVSPEMNWSTVDAGRLGGPTYGHGLKGGPKWMPSEADTPLYKPKRWFFKPTLKPRGPRDMFDLWFTSVGRNSSLNLGLAPNQSGLLEEADLKAMVALRKDLEQAFADNLAARAQVTAEHTRGADFGHARLTDGDPHAYWASADGAGPATVTFAFDAPTTMDCIWLQEAIRLGQRVDAFVVEYQNHDGSWCIAAEGQTIGWKRLLRFPTVTTKGLRVRFESEAPCLAIGEIGLYKVKVFLDEPTIARSRGGRVVIDSKSVATLRYAIGENPSEAEFHDYAAPLDLPDGGTVHAYALNGGQRSATVVSTFGVDRSGWTVTGCSDPNVDNRRTTVDLAFDDNPGSAWATARKGGIGEPPQWVSVDFGKQLMVEAVTYLPRQQGSATDAVAQYRIETSLDGEHWQVAAEGEFSNILNNPVEQVIVLDTPVSARHLRFTGLRAAGNAPHIGVAELGVRGRTK